MMNFRFLDLPSVVRKQIYRELLVPPTFVLNGLVEQRRPSTDILYTNRQIYAESSDTFYSRNLFTAVSTNVYAHLWTKTTFVFPKPCSGDEEGTLTRGVTLWKIPRPRTIAQCTRFAMTMDVISPTPLHPYRPAMFVVSARMLHFFVRSLPCEMVYGAIDFSVENTFHYQTITQLSELLFGRLTGGPVYHDLGALRIKGPVSMDCYRAMVRKFVSYEKMPWHQWRLIAKLYGRDPREFKPLRPRPSRASESVGIHFGLLEYKMDNQPRIMLDIFDIRWDCQEFMVDELEHECAGRHRDQYAEVVDLYRQLIRTYSQLADVYPARASTGYLRAHEVAEEALDYVDRADRSAFPEDLEEYPQSDIDETNAIKADLYAQAAMTCSKLGDETAALSIMQDAWFYEM
ncbi:hypothetical protein BDV95DRAFT_175437 [Massariosphaeria phaeospora]|uniref:Uncharacterized protein n=1 Tax=Massariosphaeria phaeospora TaxID=100035 RepID=A0A7C8I0V7_9PLEO|nr:hypothetical protein BDV95DRAFT_175437 [Massariosphaeria phaeospora]